jgi:hypothetical protein
MDSASIHKPDAMYAAVLIVFVSETDDANGDVVCVKIVYCVSRL